MNVLSLFDGISCGHLALDRAGIKVDNYFASEIDKYAIQVTQSNYPDTIQLGDVNNYEQWNLPKIDLLIGGSPCQDLSLSKNNREGLNGARSGLFYKYVECLHKFKPKYFLLENVSSMKKEDKDKITELMGVEPILINSALVSGQLRKRLYWTNIPNITQPEDKGILLKDVIEYCNKFNENDDIGIPIDAEREGQDLININVDKSKCIMARDGCGFGNQIHTGVLNSVRLLNYGYHQTDRLYDIHAKSVSLDTTCKGNYVLDGYNAKRLHIVKDGKIYLKKGPFNINLPDGLYEIRKLTVNECEMLQTLPLNYTIGLSNTQRYKCIGNGWTVDVIAHIFSFIPKEE